MYSRRTCLESALQLLEFQAVTSEHTQERPRGRSRNLRDHISSLTAHDYLLAGTLVCMDLYSTRDQEKRDDASTPSTNSSAATPASSTSGGRGSVSSNENNVYIPGLSFTREDVIAALQRSRDIWMLQRDFSMEAYKASELLNVLLYHLKTPFSSPAQQAENLPIGIRPPAQGAGNNDEQTAAMTLGMLQAGNMASSHTGMPSAYAIQAAQMAQQAQMQTPSGGVANQMPWDKNQMDTFLAGNQPPMGNNNSGQNMFSPEPQDWGSLFGAGNGMFPQTIFGNPNSGAGSSGMNIDWVCGDPTFS